jgi:hypothetical protein
MGGGGGTGSECESVDSLVDSSFSLIRGNDLMPKPCQRTNPNGLSSFVSNMVPLEFFRRIPTVRNLPVLSLFEECRG